MSTELVPATSPATGSALAQYAPLEGVGFDASVFDLRPLSLELVQRTNAKGRIMPGTFRIKNTEDVYDELKVVVFGQSTPRVLYPTGSKPGDGVAPLCRSRDGQAPITNDDRLEPQALNCENCDHASWKKWNKTKKREDKPACQEKVRLFLVGRNDMIPYILQLSGRSLSKNVKECLTWKSAAQQVALIMFRIKQQRKQNLNLFDFSMTIRPQEVENPAYRSSSFVVGFSDIAPIGEEDRAQFHTLYRQYTAQHDRINSEADAVEAEGEFEEAATETASVDQTSNVSYEV